MPHEITTRQRVQRLAHLLSTYATDDDRYVCLIDLLADAGHWCEANRADFHHALRVAARHYHTERNDQPTAERRLP